MKRVFRRVVKLFRQVGVAGRAELQAFARRGKLRRRTVLYESFAGNGVLCNPEAIFREVLRSSDLAELCHIWALNSLSEHSEVQQEFAENPRVRFVRRRSLAYFRALATSKYLINNATFPAEFSKRPGQIYLNTWHGTPLKRMGYDMPNGALDSANTLRNFVAADFLLSQNSFMTEQMYEKAYKLRGVFRGLVIEEGYPGSTGSFSTSGRRLRRGRDWRTTESTLATAPSSCSRPPGRALISAPPRTMPVISSRRRRRSRKKSVRASVYCSKRIRLCTD